MVPVPLLAAGDFDLRFYSILKGRGGQEMPP